MTTLAPSSPPVFQTPGRWRRFACLLYEIVLVFGVLFVAGYLFDTLTQSKHALMFRHWRQAWLFFIVGFYFVPCWRLGGQTLPMKTWHIRIIDANGQRISIWKGIARYALSGPLTFLGLNYIWSWFDHDQQFLSDRLLGTRLVLTKLPKTKR